MLCVVEEPCLMSDGIGELGGALGIVLAGGYLIETFAQLGKRDPDALDRVLSEAATRSAR